MDALTNPSFEVRGVPDLEKDGGRVVAYRIESLAVVFQQVSAPNNQSLDSVRL